MKTRCVLLMAALALLLAGCQAEEPPETVSVPSDALVQTEKSAPSEKLEPSHDPLGELLAQNPIDDNHDAFLVDTGGRLGTLLVTVELGERDPERMECPLYFTVWNPKDMSRPVQEMESTTFNVFHWHEELDANFDGHGDFSYTYAMGNQPTYSDLWVWDEDAGQFLEVPEYSKISSPRCNPETGIIDGWARWSAASDGVTTFHRWEDGELVCIRRIESCCGWGEGEVSTVSVEDRVDGALRQVYYGEFPWNAEEIEGRELWRQVRYRWEDLDYHGEP